MTDANVEWLVGEWSDWWERGSDRCERGVASKSVKMVEERYTRHITAQRVIDYISAF